MCVLGEGVEDTFSPRVRPHCLFLKSQSYRGACHETKVGRSGGSESVADRLTNRKDVAANAGVAILDHVTQANL